MDTGGGKDRVQERREREARAMEEARVAAVVTVHEDARGASQHVGVASMKSEKADRLQKERAWSFPSAVSRCVCLLLVRPLLRLSLLVRRDLLID